MFPTFCDLSGATHPDSLDGISILPTILGKGKQALHDYLYWEFPEGSGQQAVRLDNWKGIRDSTRFGKKDIMLFNLETDIIESMDVSSDHADIVKKIGEIMASSHEQPELGQFDIFRAR